MKNVLFKDLNFSIYEYGSDLAPKRSKILRELIEKNGGKYIHLLNSNYLIKKS